MKSPSRLHYLIKIDNFIKECFHSISTNQRKKAQVLP